MPWIPFVGWLDGQLKLSIVLEVPMGKILEFQTPRSSLILFSSSKILRSGAELISFLNSRSFGIERGMFDIALRPLLRRQFE